ncbi:MAG: ABC transporter permease [Chloroflexota bacterium]|nr:ABC transporter permease [Chloroflexota bacterium]
MNKLWLVARYELMSNLKKRAFLIAAIGGPIFMLLLMAVIVLVTVQTETDLSGYAQIGVVDDSGAIVYTDDPTATVQDPPAVMFVSYPDADSAAAALAAAQIGAYIVVPADYVRTGAINLFTSGNASSALTETIERYLIRNVGADLDPDVLARVITPSAPMLRFLDSGRVVPIEAILGLLLVPLLFVLLFLITAQTTSGYLMSGVVEEKSNRVMEILITSLKPVELLAGKIIGLGALGLIQMVIWVVIAAFGATFAARGASPFLSAIVLPTDLLIMGLVYFLLGYAFLSTMMASVGVIIVAEQEARQVAGLVSLVFAAPFFAIIAFFTDPNGGLVTFLSLFPLTSPTSMIMRMAFTAVPIAQHAIAIALLIGLNIVILWIGARIFRFALLMYGKKLSVREIVGLLRRRPANTLASVPTSETAIGGAR